jgi:pimeloyl-ACP methyl ester carboxylesterase
MGAPSVAVAIMRLLPMWRRLTAVAHTLPYDLAILGDYATGKAIDPADWADVKVPTLVMDGTKAPRAVRDSAATLAAALPDGHHASLPGQGHAIRADVLAPVLTGFFR